ncbi:TIGR01777 family oxidoreductase [Corynebacterium camporealensis]|uniref:TIGR01777 family oxidoreductase n=1 Tax=Corynebacterium camporealensis TaxID=161896 RepID=UPI0034CED94E
MSLRAQHIVPAPRTEVWEWHTHPGAITRLTPPFSFMTPLQQADSLADGTTILGLPGGLKWIARHDLSRYRSGYSFADVCTNAPMRRLAHWRHDHHFADHDEGTLITDEVDTRLPDGPLQSMFAYRQHQLREDFGFLQRLGDLNDRKLTVAITGSRGTVGRALTAQLTTGGHKVIQLVRKTPKDGQRQWHPNGPRPGLLDGVDVVVHLAGEPIFGRFNDSHKQQIRDSRVEPTRKLAELAARTDGFEAFICASAIGFYGSNRGEEELHEDTSVGDDFLADVVSEWEGACEPARKAGLRVANVRTGVVLSGNGGMLPILRTLFSTGLGGPISDGEFWFSWIALDDLSDIYYRAIVDKRYTGPINAVAPNPLLHRDFVKALAKEIKRPAFLPIPAFGPALLLGKQGARELALADQKVMPTALNDLNHHFRYPDLEPALAHELGGEELRQDS